MTKGKCEKCGKVVGLENSDYCAHCSKDLCDECMQSGCCGHVPAVSGLDTDLDAMTRRLWRKTHPDKG